MQVGFDEFLYRIGAWLQGRCYVPVEPLPKLKNPADDTFRALWGARLKESADSIRQILQQRGWDSFCFYTAGRWKEILGSFVVVVRATAHGTNEALKAAISALTKARPRLRGVSRVMIFLFVDKKPPPSMKTRLLPKFVFLPWIDIVRCEPIIFSADVQKILYYKEIVLPPQEFELQAFSAWAGWWHFDPTETGGADLIALKVPVWAYPYELANMVETLTLPVKFRYNELEPTEEPAISYPELLRKFEYVVRMEGCGELNFVSSSTGTRVLGTNLQEILILNPRSEQIEYLEDKWPKTRELYQRSGWLLRGDHRPGIKVARDQYKHLDFFQDFLRALKIDLKLPPGYGKRLILQRR